MYGMLSDVALAGQSSFGTSNVASLRTIPIKTENIELTIEQKLDPALLGRFAESPRYSGKRTVAGNLTFLPQPTFLGTLLYAALGQESSTLAASLYNHVMRPRNTADWDASAALPPFSALVNRDVTSSMLYFDLCATDLSLDFANGEIISGQIGWMGGRFVDNAKVGASFPTEKEWTWDTFSASYGGQPLNVRKGNIKIVNNLEQIFWMGNSVYPAIIKRKSHVQVTGQLTLQFQTFSHFYDYFKDSQTGSKLALNFLSTVASPAILKIEMPQTRIMKYPPAITGPGALEVAMDYVAEFNVASSTQLEVTLTNTMPAYP